MTSIINNAPLSTLDFIDAASGKLVQAQAVLSLLSFAGNDISEGFTGLQHKTIMDNLWAVQEIIEQAQEAVRGFAKRLPVTKEIAQ